MRSVAVITTSRADYGIYTPVLEDLRSDPEFDLRLLVSGMHLSPQFGITVREIERDGFVIDDRIEMLLASDSPEAISKSMGLGAIGFAQAYSRRRPDMLLALGDRFEMHAAVVAALPFKIPVAHIHGGEITEGAIDDALRHSITKLSHLHFVAAEEYRDRILQMGEEPWRVVVSGAPALDNLHRTPLLTKKELETRFHFDLSVPPLLVTFHPETLEHERTESHIRQLLFAIESAGIPVVFTAPNADTSGHIIAQRIHEYCRTHDRAWLVDNLGFQAYLSLMSMSACMVGNTSSGLIEAPSLQIPVVNVGDRQKGRIRSKNVIDCPYDQDAVLEAIRRALTPEFRATLRDLVNPYGDGKAAQRIVSMLKTVSLDEHLIRKRFQSTGAGSCAARQ